MVRSSTVVHALIGALVGVVLSFLPFSTVIGGAVAGFLEGSDTTDGAVSGALSGAVMFLPVAAVAMLILGFLGFGFGLGGFPAGGFLFTLILVGFVSVFFLLYTVGLAAIGGILGAYVAREYPGRRRRMVDAIGLSPSTAERGLDEPAVERRPDRETERDSR